MNGAYTRMTAWRSLSGGPELLVVEWDCKVEEVGGEVLGEGVVGRDVWGLIQAQGDLHRRL